MRGAAAAGCCVFSAVDSSAAGCHENQSFDGSLCVAINRTTSFGLPDANSLEERSNLPNWKTVVLASFCRAAAG